MKLISTLFLALTLPAAGGPSREIWRDSKVGGIWGPDWTPDGRNVIFEASSSPRVTTGYMIAPVAGGAARDIGIALSRDGQFPRSFGALRVHPNGRQLVYVARSDPGRPYDTRYETWVLENFLPKAAK